MSGHMGAGALTHTAVADTFGEQAVERARPDAPEASNN